jgi:plastocyanin
MSIRRPRVHLRGLPGEHPVRMTVALACACVLSAYGYALGAEKPTIHRVIIEGTAYQPAALTIRRGDTVEWVNKDPFPHTVTAAPAFDSGNIAAGKSWRHTPKSAGEYSYLCSLHPNMKGTLEVR